MEKIHLVVIDPQHDFCHPEGALPVRGADKDMKRLDRLVRRMSDRLSAIHCTMDNHHIVHIAHPCWWKDRKGRPPAPFTILSAAQVESGEWTTFQPGAYPRSLEYVRKLKANGRYPLCIWPPHCLIGSPGATVVPDLFEAFKQWEEGRHAVMDFVSKGSNPWTEHYSAVQADVPDPDDPGTWINTRFIQTLEEADTILLSGEAGSHCLANTVRDVADHFHSRDYIRKMVFLEDATSPVAGFEAQQEAFVREMTARGMKRCKTDDF